MKQRIRDLGERLDAHRKRQQALHSELTLTGIYNVLEKLRSGDHWSPQRNGDGSSPPHLLTDKEKKIHDDGLVTILKQIHDDLDAAVYEAYGWTDILEARRMLPNQVYDFETGTIAMVDVYPAQFDAFLRECEEDIEQELLKRLVALNHQRAEEEKRGLIRWLRPDYQNCSGGLRPSQDAGETSDGHRPPLQENLPGTEIPALPQSGIALPSWPSALSEQVTAIQKLLPTTGPDASALAGHFGKRTKARIQQIEEILKTLEGLGKL